MTSTPHQAPPHRDPTQFRFGVISDLHITLPHTTWDNPGRFHLVEVSIPALEKALAHLVEAKIDFLLLPGDLTQHGEPDNHRWLAERLAQLPFPVYVIPGNHDGPNWDPDHRSIGLKTFVDYYRHCGYEDQDPGYPYYSRVIWPGVRLIALNSNDFDSAGNLVGQVDPVQMRWLQTVLEQSQEQLILVMIHHNVVEHLRGQSRHPWGRRYILKNAPQLRALLRQYGVQMVFTGHLHIQNIAHRGGVYDITTGSLVSYPHPYRLIQCQRSGQSRFQIESYRVSSLPEWPDLLHTSREWMARRSLPAMASLLSSAPFNLPDGLAQRLAPQLKYLWSEIAAGDARLSLPGLPDPVRRRLETLNRPLICEDRVPVSSDNQTTLMV